MSLLTTPRIQVLTTFSEEGLDIYGLRFAGSFRDFWPTEVALTIVLEDTKRIPLSGPDINYSSLEQDRQWCAFVARNGKDPGKIGDCRNPNMQSIKFCHKVFALGHMIGHPDWLIWIDADVETHSPVTMEWLAGKLELSRCYGHALVYLGRKDMPYTETGFVAYNMRHPATYSVLGAMREVYTSDHLYTLGENNWHDAHVFDYCRELFSHPTTWHDLSKGVSGIDVWPNTVLASVMRHNKGPSRKEKAYGRSC